MKIEELPSGSYRVRKTYKGKTYTRIFDYKPTAKEVAIVMGELMQDDVTIKGTFEKYAKKYIQNRDGVISPSTVRTYNTKIKQLSDDFKRMNIYDITSEVVQREVSAFALDHAPKTTKTLYGFISSVLSAYRPNLRLRVKLPQAIAKAEYEPSEDDVRRILNHVKGTRYSVPFQLAVLGCRRAEVCALDINDLDGNKLWIHRSKVYLDGKWIVKETPKTDASNRILPLPENLVKEIQEQGFIYDGYPAALLKALNRTQDQLGIPRFRLHAMRVFFVSYAHSLKIPDADIQAIGGWASPNIMRKIYRKSMEKNKQKSLEMYTEKILS